MFLFDLLIAFVWVIALFGFLPIFSFVYNWVLWELFGAKVGAYMSKQKSTVCRIYPPLENNRSMGEMEAFFRNLSSTFSAKSPKDVFIEGKWYENVTLEVHSNEGKVAFYLKAPTMMMPLIRASFESHCPGTTLVETEDPFQNWGTEWTESGNGKYKWMYGSDIGMSSAQGDLHPTASWKVFQMGSQAPIQDPISQLISILEEVEEGQYAVLQIILRSYPPFKGPLKKWEKEFAALRQEYTTNASVEVGEDGNVSTLTEEERRILNAAQLKMRSETFKIKLRYTYFSETKGAAGLVQSRIFSFFKQFNTSVQSFKPEADTKTSQDFGGENNPFGDIVGAWVARLQENFYWVKEQYYRKKRIYVGMLKRDINYGAEPWFVDVESLAAVYHFPITNPNVQDVSKAAVLSSGYGESTTTSVAGLPPTNLPT